MEIVRLTPALEATTTEALTAEMKAVSVNLLKSIKSSLKSRWEEAEDAPYIDGSIWELQVQFNGEPLDVIHGGVISTPVNILLSYQYFVVIYVSFCYF